MHFIELEKFDKSYKDIKTTLDRWIAFLNRAYEIDKDNIPAELAVDKEVSKAIETLDIMYLDKEEREIYENDLKMLRIQKSEIMAAEKKGIEKGIEVGKIATASEMLLDGESIEKIIKYSKLSEKEILKLKNELC